MDGSAPLYPSITVRVLGRMHMQAGLLSMLLRGGGFWRKIVSGAEEEAGWKHLHLWLNWCKLEYTTSRLLESFIKRKATIKDMERATGCAREGVRG
ncbi:hypothetical protein AV654_14975 [Paenibacillus elgii]|uniref:Uncharacterized protein n=1 Tax=Paenibacillus elgii TaxID=189691 RepID=A0A163YLJ7_9BACL|nr:hypothetical protein AV654_14975 [Paenibacillus elgii]